MRNTLIILITGSLLFLNCRQDQTCDNRLSTLITNQFQSDSSLKIAYRNNRHLHFQKLLKSFCRNLSGKSRILLIDKSYSQTSSNHGLLFIYDDNSIYTYDGTRDNFKIARGYNYDPGNLRAMLNAYKDFPIEKITKEKEDRHLLLDAPHYIIFYGDLKEGKLNSWVL